MANKLYNIGRQAFLTEVTVGPWTGQIDWVKDDIWGRLVDSSEYSVDLLNDTSLADVSSAKSTAGFYDKVGVDGVAFARTLTFPNVPAGRYFDAVVIYRHDVPTNETVLIAYIDTATGLPAESNGSDVNIIWDGGSGRVFRL